MVGMVGVAFDAKAVVDLRTEMRKAGARWVEVRERVAHEAALIGEAEASKRIAGNDAVFTGKLAASPRASVLSAGTDAAPVTIGKVSTNVKWAAAVDLGRKPGTWPGKGLLAWVTAHIGDFARLLTKRGRARSYRAKGANDDLASAKYAASANAAVQARRVSFVIAREIKREGIKARPFFTPALAKMASALPGITDGALRWFTDEGRS